MSSFHESRALFQQSKLEWIIPLPLAPTQLGGPDPECLFSVRRERAGMLIFPWYLHYSTFESDSDRNSLTVCG